MQAADTAQDSQDHGDGHGHSHGHAHEHGSAECGGCDDPDHKHAHTEHGHPHSDGSNGHSHGHDGHDQGHSHAQRQETTAAARFGIRSFVYSRRLPFHPQRCGGGCPVSHTGSALRPTCSTMRSQARLCWPPD